MSGFGVAIRPVFVAICIVAPLKVAGITPFLQISRINSSDGASRHPNRRTDFKFSPTLYGIKASSRAPQFAHDNPEHPPSVRTLRLNVHGPLVAKFRASQIRAGEDGRYEDRGVAGGLRHLSGALGSGASMPMTTVLTALRASFGAEYIAKLYAAL